MLTTARLSGYAQSCGFENERERLGMILAVPKYQQDALEKWLSDDGTRSGLLAILRAKRKVGE